MRLLLVSLGGAAGTAARYLLGSWVQRAAGPGFPAGTLAVNLIGSFLIAVVMHLTARGALSAETRLLLATGVLGGFTTYSAFNHETIDLFQRGATGLGLLYVGVTLIGCLGAGALGLLAGRLVAGA